MSADLDALDRGVIEAGLTAAQALARVEALEARVAALSAGLCAAFQAAGQPERCRELEAPRHLHLLRGDRSE